MSTRFTLSTLAQDNAGIKSTGPSEATFEESDEQTAGKHVKDEEGATRDQRGVPDAAAATGG